MIEQLDSDYIVMQDNNTFENITKLWTKDTIEIRVAEIKITHPSYRRNVENNLDNIKNKIKIKKNQTINLVRQISMIIFTMQNIYLF
jgi:hypothetical protein